MVAQQEMVDRRARKFRSAAETAKLCIERAAKNVESAIEHIGVNGRAARCGGRHSYLLVELFNHVACGGRDLFAVVMPGVGDLVKNGSEPRMAEAILRRKIGTAEERFETGRKPYRHGPAAAAGAGLHKGHVDTVDVGPLLAIHFDGHVIAIKDLRDGIVLKRFVLHHMAPVARGVADGKKNRLVFGARLLEGLRPPRIPVHRIGGVLEQIGTLLLCETVCRHVFVTTR